MAICLCQNEYSRHLSGVLSVTFDHYHWLLRLASIFIETYTITWNARYRQLVNEHPRNPSGTFGNFRPLSLTTSACVNLHTSNARYRQLVNTIMLMNTLAILRGSFGNFRPLSLTTSACVNLHHKLTTDYFERALSPTCEHYNVNEHPHNLSGYFR